MRSFLPRRRRVPSVGIRRRHVDTERLADLKLCDDHRGHLRKLELDRDGPIS